MSKAIPILDLAPLFASPRDPEAISSLCTSLHHACRTFGFFYVINHGVSSQLQDSLEAAAKRFFSLPESSKLEISMSRGGRAWRGYFPVGDELTSGKPDLKEGLYFGSELSPDDPRCLAAIPMHGQNLFPSQIPELRPLVLEYQQEMEKLGHTIMKAIAMSLGLNEEFFESECLIDPVRLFRIFNYPPSNDPTKFGVGEHTDYGKITILKQSIHGGLEVRTPEGEWLSAPPVENSFVCNLGDMLQAVTDGLYLSTPHRVRNLYSHGADRLSFPFFFDPSWNWQVKALPIPEHIKNQKAASGGSAASKEEFIAKDSKQRWDGTSPQLFQGTYGEYLLMKVGKAFPSLKEDVLN
jgi:isopenicillin N synthase-like dioxygenase